MGRSIAPEDKVYEGGELITKVRRLSSLKALFPLMPCFSRVCIDTERACLPRFPILPKRNYREASHHVARLAPKGIDDSQEGHRNVMRHAGDAYLLPDVCCALKKQGNGSMWIRLQFSICPWIHTLASRPRERVLSPSLAKNFSDTLTAF